MIKRMFSVALSLLLVLILFSSCSSGEGEDLYYPVFKDPVSFDPQIASDNASKIVVFNCFEGLVKVDKDGKIVPGVAERWEVSSDGLVYTFHLRQNAKWYMSDSAKELLDADTAANFNYRVTAEDFVYGFERAFDKDMGASTDSRLYVIKNAYDVYAEEKEPDELGVTALSTDTLQVELSEPNEDFLKALTQSAAMPCRKEFFEATKGRYGLDPDKVIYNGPFYLGSWNTGVNLALYKNEKYSGKNEVKPTAVYLYVNDNLETRVDKIEDGTYDACPLTVRQKSKVENDKTNYISYGNATWGFAFNCANEIMKNYDMRAALTNAINVNEIVLPEHCTSYADGVVPHICLIGNSVYRGYAGKIKYPAADETKAKTHLEKAFEELEIDSVSINIICQDNYENTVKLAVQKWQKALGIDVNFIIEPLDELTLERRVSLGEYQLAFTKLTAQSESAVAFLGMFTSVGTNNTFFMKSKAYDELIGTTAESFNREEIISNCIKAERYLISKSVVIPMFYEDSYVALAEDVSGIYAVEAGTIPIFAGGIRK